MLIILKISAYSYNVTLLKLNYDIGHKNLLFYALKILSPKSFLPDLKPITNSRQN